MKIIACNWKMLLSQADASKLGSNILTLCNSQSIILFPSFLHISAVAQTTAGSLLGLGAQNLSSHALGNFTGEISAGQIAEAECKYVLIGHSERRVSHGENAAIIKQKITQALQAGLKVVLCIGEPLEDYKNGTSQKFVIDQLEESLDSSLSHEDIILAYEPIWAIGSGLTPTIQDITLMFEAIKTKCNWNGKILYGGSVNEQNISWLNKIQIVDGFLIGSASTKFSELSKIISTVYST